MNSFLAIFFATAIGLWVLSFVVEAFRTIPQVPRSLPWAPEIPIRYLEIEGSKIRYITTGNGRAVVLLHTLRTQLDLFEKVVPELAKSFKVFALDYPGHGYSDIPKGRYDADFFVRYVEQFLDTFNLRDALLVGVSIGASIALILAGRRNPRISSVVAINPYDYDKGRGMARSSLLGRMITFSSLIPILGESVMRLRNFIIMRDVLRGGVKNPQSIPPELLKEMYEVGNRPEHYRAFVRLLRNAASWETAGAIYGNISVPVLLVWADSDWAKAEERERVRARIPGAQMVTIGNGGHFLPLEQPEALLTHIMRFGNSEFYRASNGRSYLTS